MRREYAVLGGGVLGLTAGLRLAQRGHGVTIFEREPEPGGLAAGFRVPGARADGVRGESDGVWLEKFYHHLFRSDRHVIGLIEELGLGGGLEWRRPLTVSLVGGRAYQLDSALSLLRFPVISPAARLHMAVGLAVLRLLPSPERLEGRRAVPWLRRWMGDAGYEKQWGPLFRGKFGAVAEDISLPWFWARVHDRTASLGYVRGGFQRFYNRLAERVAEQGGTLRFGTDVTGIERDDGGLIVRARAARANDESRDERFDRVISTLPTRLTCRLAPQLPSSYRERYEWGQAFGAHCLILALDRQLTDSYWMNINDAGYPFMVLVEHTNYMPVADYGGRHLVYLGNYRAMDDPLFSRSKEEVLTDFLPHLARINPAFEASWVTESWMFSAPYAQPIVTPDYRAHIPPFETPVDGLYVANMFQVYPHDRGQNYSVELAERLVRTLEPDERAAAADAQVVAAR